MPVGPVWREVKDNANGAEAQEFDSLASQIGRSPANGSPLLRRFFEAVLPTDQALSRGDRPCHLLLASA